MRQASYDGLYTFNDGGVNVNVTSLESKTHRDASVVVHYIICGKLHFLSYY